MKAYSYIGLVKLHNRLQNLAKVRTSSFSLVLFMMNPVWLPWIPVQIIYVEQVLVMLGSLYKFHLQKLAHSIRQHQIIFTPVGHKEVAHGSLTLVVTMTLTFDHDGYIIKYKKLIFKTMLALENFLSATKISPI